MVLPSYVLLYFCIYGKPINLVFHECDYSYSTLHWKTWQWRLLYTHDYKSGPLLSPETGMSCWCCLQSNRGHFPQLLVTLSGEELQSAEGLRHHFGGAQRAGERGWDMTGKKEESPCMSPASPLLLIRILVLQQETGYQAVLLQAWTCACCGSSGQTGYMLLIHNMLYWILYAKLLKIRNLT